MKNNVIPAGDLKSAFANRQAKESEKTAPSSDLSDSKAAFIARFTQEKLDKWKQEHGGRESNLFESGE
ncbi:hypothetical protein [Flavobacterium sp. GNP002]